MPTYHLATFTCDVTPPLGHPLCGGWIEPARAVDDPLSLVGVVLFGDERPVVLAVVDWCGLRNQAHRIWRRALADAAHTTPDRVALHCVHPHDTPFADTEAQKLIAAAGAPPSLDLAFYDQCVNRSAEALKSALAKTRRFTQVGVGSATVEKVASNRRVIGPDGTVKFTRTSATKNPTARDAPEGVIDPQLRTLSFWDGTAPLAALHFYATHPMSHYAKGRVSADFCGLARAKRQAEMPDVFQVYFTGAAGNVTAGKYNDGSEGNRIILRDRIHAGMIGAWKATVRHPVGKLAWRSEPLPLLPREEPTFGEAASKAVLADPKQTAAKRNNAAFQLAWLARRGIPLDVCSLDLGDAARTLHLPGEPFIEYQLGAAKLAPGRAVCVAGYTDGGPGYIPTTASFPQGGYEPTVALAHPTAEELLHRAIAKVLA